MANNQAIRDKYRAVFCQSPLGQEVLEDIVVNLCHFGVPLDADNKQLIGEFNVGLAIMAKCGIIQKENQNDVIRALCSVALPILKEKK